MSSPSETSRNAHEAETKPNEAGTSRPAPARRSAGGRWLGRLVLLALVVLGVAAAHHYLYPRAMLALNTVSTDDAYVNSHLTHVAPRIAENVRDVRVDTNDFVKKGELLIVLDDALWKVHVRQAQAALLSAHRSRDVAIAKARSTVSAARANRFKLASTMSDVKNQVAGLRVAVARLNEAKAAERLAKAEAERYAELAHRKSITQEQADVRQSDYEQARARVRQALEEIHRIRAGLELPEEPDPGHELAEVPPDLEQRHSSVLSALGQVALSLSDLGLPLPSYYATPDEFLAEVRKKAPNGDIDALIEQTVKKAPERGDRRGPGQAG